MVAKGGLIGLLALSVLCFGGGATSCGGAEGAADGTHGVIVSMENGELMLGLGSEKGMKEGLPLAITRRTGRAAHPVTGEIYYTRTETLARAKVTSAQEGLSFAKLAESTPASAVPKAGDEFVVDGKGTYTMGTLWMKSEPEVIVSEDFSQDLKPTQWTCIKGKATVKNGVLCLSPDSDLMLAIPLFAASLDVDLDAWSDAEPHYGCHVATGDTDFSFYLTRDGVSLIHYKAGLEDWKTAARRVTVLKGKKYHHRVTMEGRHLRHFVNGALIHDVAMDTPLSTITKFGLWTGREAFFDNLRIIGLPCDPSAIPKGPLPPAKGYVLFVDDKEAMTDYGGAKALSGQRMITAHISRVVDHPRTQQPFAVRYEKSGEIEVVSVEEKTCRAKITVNEGIKYGDRVFFAQTGKPFDKTWWQNWVE